MTTGPFQREHLLPVIALLLVGAVVTWAYPNDLALWRQVAIVTGWIGAGLMLASLLFMVREPGWRLGWADWSPCTAGTTAWACGPTWPCWCIPLRWPPMPGKKPRRAPGRLCLPGKRAGRCGWVGPPCC